MSFKLLLYENPIGSSDDDGDDAKHTPLQPNHDDSLLFQAF